MKAIFFTIVFSLFFGVSFSQITFEKHHIANITGDGNPMLIADFDGDGYPDILAGKKLLKNLDGLGNFGPSNLIFNDPSIWIRSFCSLDYDNDSDIDVIALDHNNYNGHEIVLLENIGSGNFSVTSIMTLPDIDRRDKIYAADLNGDGLQDLIHYSYPQTDVLWYQNMDGQGNFSNGNVIFNDYITDVHSLDIDGDTDLDVLIAHDYGKVTLLTNMDGTGNFDNGTIINESLTTNCCPVELYMDSVDIDQDGDLDLLTFGLEGIYDYTFGGILAWETHVAWQENLDGLGGFGEKNIIYYNPSDLSPSSGKSMHSFFEDMDNDGDMDIIIGKNQYSKIFFYENDGNSNFDSNVIQHHNNISLHEILPYDINGDDKIDLFYADDYSIGWFENLGLPLSIEEYENSHFTLFPNPVRDSFEIKSKDQIEKIDIYSIKGILVLSPENKKQVDVSQLTTGMYFVKVHLINGTYQTVKILKQ